MTPLPVLSHGAGSAMHHVFSVRRTVHRVARHRATGRLRLAEGHVVVAAGTNPVAADWLSHGNGPR